MKIFPFGILISLVCIGIGLFLLSGSWGVYAEYKRVQEYDGRAVGYLINKQFKGGSDGGGNYYVDYWFISSTGIKISATGTIAKQQWDVLKVDDTMEIRYDQSNPSRNSPMCGGSPSLVFAFLLLAMGTIFIIFGYFRFLRSFKRTLKEKLK